jgi:hypothetical protein
VDVASLCILEKLGFRQVAKQPGRFGSVLLFMLEGDPASRVY